MSVLPCCSPRTVLMPTPLCPPYAVLILPSLRHPCADLLTTSSSCRPFCAIPLVSHVAPLMLPSSCHCTILSCCHCLMLSCHPPRAILPYSLCHPPHAAVCLVPFPRIGTPYCLHHTIPNVVHHITTHPSKQLGKYPNAPCTWPTHTSVMSNKWPTNICKLPGLSHFLLPLLFLDLQYAANGDPSSWSVDHLQMTHPAQSHISVPLPSSLCCPCTL